MFQLVSQFSSNRLGAATLQRYSPKDVPTLEQDEADLDLPPWEVPTPTASKRNSVQTEAAGDDRFVEASSLLRRTYEDLSPDAGEEQKIAYEQLMDIPEDAYGALIMTIVKETAEISDHGMGLINVFRGMYVVFLMLLNLALQFGILYFIHLNVVQPAVLKVQDLYRGYRSRLFDEEGNFDEEIWKGGYHLKQDICQIAMTSDVFLYIILLLWTFSMLSEFRVVFGYVVVINSMPTVSAGKDMLYVDGDSTSIVALMSATRYLLYLGVCVPKVAISGALLWLGLRWLSAATSFEDLVMNTVAMEFVIRVDDLLYSVVLPHFLRCEVSDVDFCGPKREKTLDEINAHGTEIKQLVGSSLVIIAAIAFPFFFINYVQDILPTEIGDIKTHCKSYLEKQVPLCSYEEIRDGACFPYGGKSPSHADYDE